MRCENVMKRTVECVSTHDTVQVAANIMREKQIGFLPVCDASRKVVGTLTDRDITTRLVAQNQPGSAHVESIMTHDVVSCSPSEDVRTAEELMARNHKSRIMCLDIEGKPVGVISLSDIAQFESDKRAARTMREIATRESALGI